MLATNEKLSNDLGLKQAIFQTEDFECRDHHPTDCTAPLIRLSLKVLVKTFFLTFSLFELFELLLIFTLDIQPIAKSMLTFVISIFIRRCQMGN